MVCKYSHADICTSGTCRGYRVASVYCVDSMFITDASRFIAGTLMCTLCFAHALKLMTVCRSISNDCTVSKPVVYSLCVEFMQRAVSFRISTC